MPGTVLGSFTCVILLNVYDNPSGCFHSLHFTVEEIETQKLNELFKVTWPAYQEFDAGQNDLL